MCCPTFDTQTQDSNNGVSPAQSPPLQIHSHNNDDVLCHGLPKPTNTTTMCYTKSEAAAILSKIPPNTVARGQMTRAMINLGFAPTTERSLQRIMKEKDAGKEICDDEWNMKVASGCIGIQSKILDHRAEDHLKY